MERTQGHIRSVQQWHKICARSEPFVLSRRVVIPFTKPELNELKPKTRGFFQAWDERRGPWDVVYTFDINDSEPSTSDPHEELHQVRASVRTAQNAHVPSPQINPRPTNKHKGGEEAAEDWDEETRGLFEWAAMACLGSPRYVSVCSAEDRNIDGM